MKYFTTSILAILGLSLASTLSLAQSPDAILGKWIATNGKCIVEIYKQEKEFKARIVWFTQGNKAPINEWKDDKNPDPSLRGRKLLGMDILHGLHYDAGNKEWVDGMIYDPTSGKEWDSVVWLTNDNFLKVKGYWLFKFLSKTSTFKKA